MHSNVATLFIGAHESVYGDSPIGNLDTRNLVRVMHPLQQGFCGDSETGFPVRVHYLPTFSTFEQGIVGGTMPLPNSTAVGTPFRGVPTINHVQRNIVVKASLLKNGLELSKRYSHNGLVEPSALGFEFGQLLDGNISMKAFGYLDYLLHNLPEVCSYKISFAGLEAFEFLASIERLQPCSPFHDFLSSRPNMPSKISLVKHLSIGGKNRKSKVLGIDVDSESIRFIGNLLFFGKISNNLPIREKPVGFTIPTAGHKRKVSLEISVLLNWDSYPFPRIASKLDKKIRFSGECLAIPGNIELDADGIDFGGFLLPSITNKGTDDLNIEGGVFLAG